MHESRMSASQNSCITSRSPTRTASHFLPLIPVSWGGGQRPGLPVVCATIAQGALSMGSTAKLKSPRACAGQIPLLTPMWRGKDETGAQV
jgi:hypothetical protein